MKIKFILPLLFWSLSAPSVTLASQCYDLLLSSQNSIQVATPGRGWRESLKKHVPIFIKNLKDLSLDKTLDLIGYVKRLPKYLERKNHLVESEKYLEYRNFGEMGLAELGISVRANQEKLEALNTGRPLIIVANHPLGIADGLSLQHLSSKVRQDSPSLLMLARWIEKLMPKSVYTDDESWGTAIPVDINEPDPSDTERLDEFRKFNKRWNLTTLRALKRGALVIIFPAGHVAGINTGSGPYPENVFDAPGSWQKGTLNLARMAGADIVFAQIASVNSRAFYKYRKMFGGKDKERVIWFFSEAIRKSGKAIDVYLSEPLSLDGVYQNLSRTYGIAEEDLRANEDMATELMRQYTHSVDHHYPQELNLTESPRTVD
jgi:hypothetical protein